MYECISWNNVHISVRNSSMMYFHLYATVSSKYSIVRVCIYLIKVWRTFGDNIHMRISLKRPITNRVSKVIRKWNGFALVRSHSVNYSYFLIGSENSRLPQARPIRCNTKTNYDLVTRPPALVSTLSSHWLLMIFYLCSNWPRYFLCFTSNAIQSKNPIHVSQ